MKYFYIYKVERNIQKPKIYEKFVGIISSKICFYMFAESWQLIIRSINIPAVVKANDTDYIILDCDYDLENTSSKGLVVKWFFNINQVVYQWIYGRYPLADEPAAKYVDLTYKASDDPYTEYRAIKLNKPGVDLTGEYTCVISTFADERTANASMIVYCKYQYEFIFTYTHDTYIT